MNPVCAPAVGEVVMHDESPLPLLDAAYGILILLVINHVVKHEIVLLIKFVHLTSLAGCGEADFCEVVLLDWTELVAVLGARH